MPRIRKAVAAAQKQALPQWQTAIYIRLSREDGNDESYSVTNQKQRLMACFEAITLEDSMQLAEIYIDDGFTGTDSNRDSFQRMLRDIDVGKINCIIVKDLSRLSRNDWECKRYLQHLFVVKDVRFISLELPRLDSYKRPDEIYDLGVTMQSAYNENHCRETSIKVRGTFNTKRRAGEFIGAFAPYGYQKDPENKHRLIIDEPAAAIVRDIFHWFVRDDLSKSGIVKRLCALSIPCPTAYKRQNGLNYHNPMLERGAPQWSARGVTAILENRMYLGHMVQGKQRVKSYKVHTRVSVPEEEWFIKENTHAPVIDQTTFEQAQNLLLRDTRAPPNSGKLYPFSGFLRCADCNRAMVRRAAKQHVYYACRTYITTGQCSRHSIRHDNLEHLVLNALAQQLKGIDLPGLIATVQAAPAQSTAQVRLNNAIALNQTELEKARTLFDGLYADWKCGELSHDAYRRLKYKCEEKQAALAQDITRLESELQTFADNQSLQIPEFEDLRCHGAFTQLNRGLVTQLVESIHIHEGGSIEITFSFAQP